MKFIDSLLFIIYHKNKNVINEFTNTDTEQKEPIEKGNGNIQVEDIGDNMIQNKEVISI